MKTRVLILGAGYAGMMTAIRLAGKTRHHDIEITLINAIDTFVPRIRLHEAATNQNIPVRPITQILRGTGVNFRQGYVTCIQPDQKSVSVEFDGNQQSIRYDYLVFALGSRVDMDQVEGVKQHTYALNPSGERGAAAMSSALQKLAKNGGKVVVAGGGATGIEGITEIKAFYPNLDVSLVTQGEFGGFKGERVQRHLRRAFQQQGIPVYEHRTVQKVKAGELIFTDGSSMSFDLCLWAGGFSASPIAHQSGLNVNERGQILTDPFLRALGNPQIYAIGDSANPVHQPGAPLRMSIFAAMTMGAHVADSLAAMVKGKQPKPFSFSWYGQGIALGKKDAVGFMTFPDDKPVGIILRGRVAVAFRNFFVWFLHASLDIERRIPGAFLWFGKRRYKHANSTIIVSHQPVSSKR